MAKKDNIYKVGNFNDLPFSFNEEVAEVFEDMVDRSVPGYSHRPRHYFKRSIGRKSWNCHFK